VKVTVHAAREDLPGLVRDLLLFAADRGRVQVVSVGRPGVTVDADVAARFLTAALPAATPRLAAVRPLSTPTEATEPTDAVPTERRRGRPRKTTTASSEG
jgi:hypothetical protein